MRRIVIALVSALALGAFVHPSDAAPYRGLHLLDAVGDANGVNSQQMGLPVPGVPTAPAHLAGADVLGLDVTTVFRSNGRTRKAAGFQVRLRLAEPVQQGVNYLVTMRTSVPCGGSDVVQLGYEDAGAISTDLATCQAAEPTGDGTTIGGTELSTDRKTIVWTVDAGLRAGATVTDFYASSSVFVVGVFDELVGNSVFLYGR